jgi:inhibitor of KinA
LAEVPHLRAVSDCGLLVEYADALSDGVHAAVLGLDRVLAADPLPGQTETVPAYVNLLVLFDPLLTDHAAVAAGVRTRLQRVQAERAAGTAHLVDVVYDGPDLSEVARRTGLSPEAVIAAHLSGDYSVYLYGFAPGYAYLGGVPEAIRLPRKEAPVRGVPAGSVIVAGGQCIVTTLTMPTGWWVIGRSPVTILRPEGMLFAVGDRVRFRRTKP